MADENHEKFLSHLDASNEAVQKASLWFKDRGYDVTMPETSKAKEHKDWKKHADGGDLFISQRIEVKRLSVNFTNADDWKFKPKFIVCAKHAFDNASPTPFAYLILSKNMEYCACVMGSDHRCWSVEQITDSRYEGVTQEFYLAPMESVRFFKFDTKED